MNRIGRYDVIEQIGGGASGAVYKAINPQIQGYVAIKEIRSPLAANPGVQNRFAQEIEKLVALPKHPNLVTVRDAVVFNSRFFVIRDYVEGATLKEGIRGGGVILMDGARILLQIVSGLELLHNRRILHRNLKPDNVLLEADGTARLNDFGIVEFLDPAAGAEKYLAPEVIDPRRSGFEEQSDIYSAGMLVYETLLGDRAFREALPEIYRALARDEGSRWREWQVDSIRKAPNLRELNRRIPQPLAAIIERMMEKDVAERYRSASDVKRDLLSFMQESQDSRGIREDPSDYDTRPLGQVRGGRRADETVRRPDDTLPPPRRPQLSGGRKIPAWAWYAGGGLLLASIGFVLFFVLLNNPGFTTVIKGTPPGSDVYVDNIRRGITKQDGSVTVPDLKAGKRLIRVSKEGFTDFNTSVTGRDGDVKTVIAQLTANEEKAVNEIDYTGPMVLIPAGEYIMGSDNHDDDEKPAHPVNVPAFYIDKYEVSNALYLKFCNDTKRPHPRPPNWDRYYLNKPNMPVLGVTWDDANAYAKWAGKRLVTETEWEKAASWGPEAQQKRLYPWGNNPEGGRGNYGVGDEGLPASVGQFPGGASAYGIYDMAGNVAEWVADYYRPYPGNTTPNPDYGTKNRVVRGGSFKSPVDRVRTTIRFPYPPQLRPSDIKLRSWVIGFRCAVSADDAKLQEFLKSRNVR